MGTMRHEKETKGLKGLCFKINISVLIINIALLSGIKFLMESATKITRAWITTPGWRALVAQRVQPAYAKVLGVQICPLCLYALEHRLSHGRCNARLWARDVTVSVLVNTYEQSSRSPKPTVMFDQKRNISWDDAEYAVAWEMNERGLTLEIKSPSW